VEEPITPVNVLGPPHIESVSNIRPTARRGSDDEDASGSHRTAQFGVAGREEVKIKPEPNRQAIKQSNTPEYRTPPTNQAFAPHPQSYSQRIDPPPTQSNGGDGGDGCADKAALYNSTRLKQESPPVRSPKAPWPLEDPMEAHLFRYFVDKVGVWVSISPQFHIVDRFDRIGVLVGHIQSRTYLERRGSEACFDQSYSSECHVPRGIYAH